MAFRPAFAALIIHCTVLVVALTPLALLSQHPGAVTHNTVWRWFEDCSEKKEMGIEVLLNGKIIQHSSFPICPVSERTNTTKRKQRIIAFNFKGGHVFQAEYHTLRTETITGNVWQAGAEPDVLLLGVSFSTPQQVLLNTIHIARPDSVSMSEVDAGIVVKTFPFSQNSRVH